MAALAIGNRDGREILKCADCELVQFASSDKCCRRCRRPYGPEEPTRLEPVSVEPRSLFEYGQSSVQLSFTLALRFLRNERGLSQAQLCKRMGVPRTYCSKIENGKCVPTVMSFVRFAAALEMTPYFLARVCEEFMTVRSDDLSG